MSARFSKIHDFREIALAFIFERVYPNDTEKQHVIR